MKQYYILENELQSGPFSIEALKSMRIKRTTLVRAEDVQGWHTVDEIPDLKCVLFPEQAFSSNSTKLPTPQSRRSRPESSSPPPQSVEEVQSLPTPTRRPRSISSPMQSPEPSPLSMAASSAKSSVKSSAISVSKRLKSIKLKKSTIKIFFVGIGSAAAVVLIIIFGMKYFESSKYADIGLIPVKSGNQWGYIDSKGKYLINPQFQDADYFFDGLARVVSSDGKLGYIDEDGIYAFPGEFKDGTRFSDGLAFVVSIGGYPVCIDQSGNIKFTVEQAKQISEFREGRARFSTTDGKYGFIDGAGMVVIKPQFDFASDFYEGMASIVQNGMWGYIDKTGKLMINPQFANSFIFSEGKAIFNNGVKYGYIDKKGNYLINPQFDIAYSFSEGMAVIMSGNNYGYISVNGNISINPQFKMAKPFHNGLAAIMDNYDAWGFIDKKGNIVISPQFEDVSDFFNGIAFVKSTNTWGIIDNTGKYLVNPQFENIKQRPNIIFDSEPSYIVSDYYDTSEFISNFFERVKENSYDDFNVSSTLQTLLDNATYGIEINAENEYRVTYDKPQMITNEIFISETTFNFDNPVYSYSNYGRQYHFKEKIAYIKYSLEITGVAAEHIDVIIEVLKAEIEKLYEIEMKKIGGFHGYYDSYSGYDEKSNTDFGICIGRNLDFYVGFNQGILARFFDN